MDHLFRSAALFIAAGIIIPAHGASVASFSQAQYMVSETAQKLIVDVVLSAPLPDPASVDLVIAADRGRGLGGSAMNGSDFVFSEETLAFAPGQTKQTYSISVIDDNFPERDEFFWLGLRNTTNLLLTASGGLAEVIIKDSQAVVGFISDVQVREDEKKAVLNVRRFGNAVPAFAIDYHTSSDTARAGIDFAPSAGTLRFEAGQTNQTIEIPILDNSTVDSLRSFTVSLKDLVGNAAIETDVATISITDNETPRGMLDPLFVPPAVALGLLGLQNDGKPLVRTGTNLVRLNRDGSVDSSFQDRLGLLSQGFIEGKETPLAIQPDGKIIFLADNRVVRLNSDGSRDGTWRTTQTAPTGRELATLALQRDDKILIGGQQQAVLNANGVTHVYLARLNSEGTPEQGFPAGTINDGLSAGHLLAIVSLDDGKILVGGSFASVDGRPRPSLARLNPDGTLDNTFEPTGPLSDLVSSIAPSNDGKVYVAGGAYNSPANLIRLNPDGDWDQSFAPTISAGDVPSGDSSIITALALQSDGRALIGGYLETVNGVPRNGMARLLPNGQYDSSFESGAFTNFNWARNINAIFPQTNGMVLIGGNFTGINGVPVARVARLREITATNIFEFVRGGSTESEDQKHATITVLRRGDSSRERSVDFATFARDASEGRDFVPTSGRITFAPLEVEKKVVIPLFADHVIEPDEEFDIVLSDPSADAALGFFQEHRVIIADANGRPGSLDLTFDPGYIPPNNSYGPPWAAVQVIAPLPDGRMYIAGHLTEVDGQPRPGIARLNPNGSVDPSFYPITSIDGHHLALQSDGKILAGWNFFTRLNPDGSVDAAFHQDIGSATGPDALLIQKDGKIIGPGSQGLARYNPDGSLDKTFQVSASEALYREFGNLTIVAAQPDEKILIGGQALARLTSNGTRDSTFSTVRFGQQGDEIPVRAVAVQNDGKIIVAGSFDTVNGTRRRDLCRLNPDGSLDPEFEIGAGLSYQPISPEYAFGLGQHFSLALQTDGKILLGGPFSAVDGVQRKGIVRLNVDGTVDESFDPGAGVQGRYEDVWGMAVQPDGQIVIVGNFDQFNGMPRWGIARLNGDRDLVRLAPSYSPSENTLQIDYPSATGATYRLESSSDLLTWSPGREIIGSAARSNFSEAIRNESHRFYRVLRK